MAIVSVSRNAAAVFQAVSCNWLTMLEEIGGFDDEFFLYCEDTDLGLRAVWAGWKCLYVADAIVEHRYSHSAGRASALKAYLVERNRLYVAIKNFPLGMLLKVPFLSLKRYFWHLLLLFRGQGKAAEFASEGGGARLAWFVIRAHIAAAIALPSLLAARRTPNPIASEHQRGEFHRILNCIICMARQAGGRALTLEPTEPGLLV